MAGSNRGAKPLAQVEHSTFCIVLRLVNQKTVVDDLAQNREEAETCQRLFPKAFRYLGIQPRPGTLNVEMTIPEGKTVQEEILYEGICKWAETERSDLEGKSRSKDDQRPTNQPTVYSWLKIVYSPDVDKLSKGKSSKAIATGQVSILEEGKFPPRRRAGKAGGGLARVQEDLRRVHDYLVKNPSDAEALEPLVAELVKLMPGLSPSGKRRTADETAADAAPSVKPKTPRELSRGGDPLIVELASLWDRRETLPRSEFVRKYQELLDSFYERSRLKELDLNRCATTWINRLAAKNRIKLMLNGDQAVTIECSRRGTGYFMPRTAEKNPQGIPWANSYNFPRLTVLAL